jgi:cytochrome c biogenesis protein ResB
MISFSYATKKFLRAPKVIVGEIAGLALLCVLGAALPQSGSAAPAELARLQESGPFVLALIQTFALDHIFRGAGFLALASLTAASLLVIVFEQAKRLRAQWPRRLGLAHFQGAAFRAEFERPASSGSSAPTIKMWTKRRLGLAGSTVFHAGILTVIVAAALRALFGGDAVVDLFEGETLPPTAEAWAAQWPGVLAKPVRLDCPVTLNQVKVSRYPKGDVRELAVQLAARRQDRIENVELAVNHDARIAGQRLFMGSEYGTAVFVEWHKGGLPVAREAALLAEQSKGFFEGASAGPNQLRAYLRTFVDQEGNQSGRVEVRVMKDHALLFTGDARVNDTVKLPGGESLTLHGTAFWARLRGSRDAALWLAYAGFAMVMLGAMIIFCWVKVDGCLVITPLGEQERVFMALRPQRFAASYQDYFQKWVRQHGGPELGPDLLPAAPIPMAAEAFPSRRPEVDMGVASPRLASLLLVGFCLAAFTGCQRSSTEEARRLVERYNQVVSEAYRRGDVRLIDPVVGPNEGKKLTGLIGVRLDLGITLDSQLLSLEVTGVEKTKDEMQVRTKERWRYRDLKIGTGQQVGEESLDAYGMLYIFKKIDKAWMVDEIRFTSPPQVGRKQTPWIADRHAQGKEAKQP